MNKIIFCMCCGGKNNRHKKGCGDYQKMLKAMFGNNVKALFEASDNGLLPPPPWAEKKEKRSAK